MAETGRKIDVEELKLLQLDILNAFAAFCKDKGIRYSLGYGTLIGAARHKGYIPWDDDIDIVMMRTDYERLVREFPPLLDGRYKFYNVENDKDWFLPFGKISDIRTTMREDCFMPVDLGVNIDIFALDEVPDDEAERAAFNERRRRLTARHLNLIMPYWRIKNPVKRALAGMMLGVMRHIVTPHSTAKKISRLAQTYNGTGNSRLFENGIYYTGFGPSPRHVFDTMTTLEFEGRQYPVMGGYDEFLTGTYGDWRQLPPPEKRVSHHHFDANWK